jgi:type I restriction enzyme S subunit
MAGDARQCTLGEAADLATGFPFKSSEFSDAAGDTRLLRGDNVAQGFIRWDGVKRWSELKQVSNYLLRPGDVVLAMDRPWIEAGLKHATLTEADCPSLLVQRVARLRAKPGVDQRYLGYVIRSADFTNYVLGIQTGTAVPHISGGQIKAYSFILPALKDQKKAAELLGLFDDKIELNRCIVETLEEMVAALFRDWFVDFRPVHDKAEGLPSRLTGDVADLFPDSFGDDGLPDGWRNFSLDEIVVSERASQDPAALGNQHVDHFSLPAFDGGRRPMRESARTIKSLKLDITAPVVLFSKLNPDTPRVWPVLRPTGRPMLASTEFLALKPRAGRTTLSFLTSLLLSDAFRSKAAGMVTGTSKSHQRVQPAALLQTRWPVPPQSIAQAFDVRASAMLSRIDEARRESDALIGLRDTLLPRLISGELRVLDLPRNIAAA